MKFGSAPVVGALSFVRPTWHQPWRWKSSREPVTVSDSRSVGRGSYPGRSRVGPDGATIVAQTEIASAQSSGQPLSRQALYYPVSSAVPWVFAFSMQAKQSIVVDPKSPGGVDSSHGLILFDGVCV